MTEKSRIKKLLVANRGEIACRIFRTAKQKGISTVAVYSDADREALHRGLADESFRIGPPPASQSYLVAERIIEIARSCGADAIHPGYGFLAENVEFAESCEKAGIIFVGPRAESIRVMGLKDQAKALMEKAGIAVVPGYQGKDQSLKALKKAAEKIGYPVLIKAVAGGGGKGMRLVEDRDQFEAALEGAKREAEKAFGNPAVLLERFLARSRHIEVQILGDQAGNVVHLFERDCSLQRRHQKVLEEAPAPGMTDGLRAKMCEAAVKAAKSIDYVGAGTIEFIVDASVPLSADSVFYFIEMNTRLQVEHPVTEYLTGHDLVGLQLDIAMGREIPFAQPRDLPDRHAVEIRLYAEDPQKDFLPQTGELRFFRFPLANDGLRIDSGSAEGDEISPYYDPIIAKIIAGADTREQAIERLRGALEKCFVAGCKTNLSYLAAVIGHKSFALGDMDTGFLEQHHDTLIGQMSRPDTEEFALAALALHEWRKNSRQKIAWPGADRHSPWAHSSGWRLNSPYSERLDLSFDGELRSLTLRPCSEGLRVDYNSQSLTLAGSLAKTGELTASIDGQEFRLLSAVDANRITLASGPRALTFVLTSWIDDEDVATEGPGAVNAPMPGRILKIFVAAGQQVETGQPLLIMEAMKMEYTLASPRNGVVGDLFAMEGHQISEGSLILEVHDETSKD
jgi:3-methylcrotonyl-CoA carboxylase alpha subunit